MWSGPDIASACIGLAGVVWAVVSTLLARSSRKTADAATASAADANKRAADALERANEFTAAAQRVPPPEWTIFYEQPNGWMLRNDTGHMVDQVRIESVGGEFVESNVTWDQQAPGGLIVLQAVKFFTTATVIVMWQDPATKRTRTFASTVLSP